jgi:hypothetical protein
MPGLPPPESELSDSVTHRLTQVEDYKDEVTRIVGTVPRETIELWSIFRDDALALSCFLDSLAETVAVLDVGTFVGVSAFLFASHPSVRQVLTVDPNPLVQDEIRTTGETAGLQIAPEVLDSRQPLRVQEVARAVLETFPDARERIRFEEGVISGSDASVRKVAVPDHSACGADRLIVFLDGLHTSSAVFSDLTTVLRASPHAIVFLDDCRYYWGPFVQAGVARFLDTHPEYDFKLICDSSSIVGTCTLGIVCHVDVRRTVEDAIQGVIKTVGATYGTLSAVDRVPELQQRIAALQEDIVLQTDQLAESTQTVERLTRTVGDLRSALVEARSAAGDAEKLIEDMQRSLGWRIGEGIDRLKLSRSRRRR